MDDVCAKPAPDNQSPSQIWDRDSVVDYLNEKPLCSDPTINFDHVALTENAIELLRKLDVYFHQAIATLPSHIRPEPSDTADPENTETDFDTRAFISCHESFSQSLSEYMYVNVSAGDWNRRINLYGPGMMFEAPDSQTLEVNENTNHYKIRKSEDEGIHDLQHLVFRSSLEEAWLYIETNDQPVGTWYEVGNLQTENDVYYDLVAVYAALRESHLQGPLRKICYYHFHPQQPSSDNKKITLPDLISENDIRISLEMSDYTSFSEFQDAVIEHAIVTPKGVIRMHGSQQTTQLKDYLEYVQDAECLIRLQRLGLFRFMELNYASYTKKELQDMAQCLSNDENHANLVVDYEMKKTELVLEK